MSEDSPDPSFSLVCKHWHDVAVKAPYLWRTFKISVHSNYNQSPHMNEIQVTNMQDVRRCMFLSGDEPLRVSIGPSRHRRVNAASHTVEALTLAPFNAESRIESLCADADNGRLMFALAGRALPKIHRVRLIRGLPDTHHPTRNAWIANARYWREPTLREVIINKGVEDPRILADSWVNLHKLDVSTLFGLKAFHMDWIFHLGRPLTELRVAITNGEPEFTFPNPNLIALQSLPFIIRQSNMRVLHIKHEPDLDDRFPPLMRRIRLPNLDKLYVEHRSICSSLNAGWLSTPERMAGLTVLHLTACAIPITSFEGALIALPALKVLHVRRMCMWVVPIWQKLALTPLDDKFLKALHSASDKLEELHIKDETFMSTVQLQRFRELLSFLDSHIVRLQSISLVESRQGGQLRDFTIRSWFGPTKMALRTLKAFAQPVLLRCRMCAPCAYVTRTGLRPAGGGKYYGNPNMFSIICKECNEEHIPEDVDEEVPTGFGEFSSDREPMYTAAF